MAVPKNKRYRQVVKTRRSLQKYNLVLKNGSLITKFKNYINVLSKYSKSNEVYCIFCQNNKLNLTKLCTKCFLQNFVYDFIYLKQDIEYKREKKIFNLKYDKNRKRYVLF
jgi:hypothetical protein